MPSIVQSRYDQGLAAYRAGHGIRHVVEVLDEIERGARGDRGAYEVKSGPDFSDIVDPGPSFGRDAGPSLIAGFADGVLADIRAIAGQRRGQTA